MLNGVTAFLEAIDGQAELLAQRAQEHEDTAAAETVTPSAVSATNGAHFTPLALSNHTPTPSAHSTTHAPPYSPPPPSALAVPLPPLLTDGEELRERLRQREAQVESLTHDVRRHQSAADAAREELVRRALQVHQLQDALRETRERFEEHKAKSRRLLEERQRETEALRARLEQPPPENAPNGSDACAATDDSLNASARLAELARAECETLRLRLSTARAEAEAAREGRVSLSQQLDFARLDLRGLREALDSEVAAHRRAKEQLQCRQRELHALRAAVEQQGGTFAASGALLALPGGNAPDDALGRQLLDRQRALEAARREAAEWRRRHDRTAQRLQEELSKCAARVPIATPSAAEAEWRPAARRFGPNGGAIRTAAAALDALAMHMGRVLRRRPLLRIAAVLYIVCVHIWVLTAVMMVPARYGKALPTEAT